MTTKPGDLGYHEMHAHEQVGDFAKWNSEKLGGFFRRRGLGEYYEVLQAHKITGRLGE
jgi:hypothetical protein